MSYTTPHYYPKYEIWVIEIFLVEDPFNDFLCLIREFWKFLHSAKLAKRNTGNSEKYKASTAKYKSSTEKYKASTEKYVHNWAEEILGNSFT